MRIAAIDIGGTFTDCAVFDEGTLLSLKVPSTPPRLEEGLLNALHKAAGMIDETPETFIGKLDLILQGTTSPLNTVLTRSGAKVGLITSGGFRDIIETRRGMRQGSAYNIFVPPYEPLVPRHLRQGVEERTRYTSELAQAVNESEIEGVVRGFLDQGVESIAVCFLYSYLNSENEQKVRDIIRRLAPQIPISLSSEVMPVWREYERFSTTVINAYVAPKLTSHLETIESKLHNNGFRGQLMLMTGSGLLESAANCANRAAHLVGSGPAGSANTALYVARTLGIQDVISVDMGGTSFDVCLTGSDHINTTTEGWIEGHRIALKSVASESIGAGGGSIAWIDARGLLRVGPQSAGAVPGPACYGAGGTEPTVTDANVVMGLLAPSTFRWGQSSLDLSAAENAMARVGQSLGLDTEQTAAAIYDTVNDVMANSIVRMTTQRGLDPRDFALVAGGGAGALHAAAIADRLGLQRVVIPACAGIYSAFGILSCDRGVEAARSSPCAQDSVSPATFNDIFDQLSEQAIAHLSGGNTKTGPVVLHRTVDMRYAKQFHEVEVDVPDGPLTSAELATVICRFHELHKQLYNFSVETEPVEFLTFRLRASIASDLKLPSWDDSDRDAPKPDAVRSCLVQGARRDVPVHDGTRLQPGCQLAGPALIEEQTTTVYVPPGFGCRMDKWRNYVIERTAK